MIEQTSQAVLGSRLLSRIKPFWWIPLSLLPIAYLIAQSTQPKPTASPTLPALPSQVPLAPPSPQQTTSVPLAPPNQPTKEAKKQNLVASNTGQQQQQQLEQVPQQRTTKALTPSRDRSSLQLRVAIANGADSLKVGASTTATISTEQGQTLGKIQSMQAFYAQPDGQNIRLGSWQAPLVIWIQPTGEGYVSIGDRWYRGAVRLILQGDRLLAVNYVDLEKYLYSVVGAEVSPSWPSEVLKAQAIAARSYALVHYFRPASSFYDLGATTRWQVYRGVQDEWNTTHQAVNATRGFVIGYKGGVVETMYAASDSIIANIFKGVGMSQTGAYALSKQGYDYLHILGAYYPGTSLARIQISR
jgi:peptidoglycan hydrolase-like amidase